MLPPDVAATHRGGEAAVPDINGVFGLAETEARRRLFDDGPNELAEDLALSLLGGA